MKITISRMVLLRLALAVAALAFSAACGSTGGCSGCTPTPIPGGFPQAHRFDNAMQVRLSKTGIDFMEKNFDGLVTQLVPGGLSFDVPPNGCTSGNQKICCKGTKCSAAMKLNSTTITPTPKSTAKLALRAEVKTSKIPFSYKLLFWINCDIKFDSTASGKKDLGLNADMNFVVQGSNSNKLKISRGTTTLKDFESGDIDISGGVTCTVIDWVKGLLKSTIQSSLMKTVDDTLDEMLKQLPLGQEGQFDLASFLAAFSPSTTGLMNYFMWAGGYSDAENQGMSFGMMGGFRAAKHNACVPNCEKPGAGCQPPAKVAINRSIVFRNNTRPDGKTFDVGLGVHKKALDVAAYAMYDSGGLCLDITTQTVAQLSSSLFGLLVPSLKTLTAGANVPMMLSIRPRKPPTVELGPGTFHKDKDGKVVIDKPLMTLKAKDFAMDVLLLVDERYVRVFTVNGDLAMPALLYPDATGKLQIILGDLKNALTNIKIENNALISEDPKNIAAIFPTILGLAAGFLGSGFDPIALPSISGLELQLPSGSITTVESNQILSIFAKLAIAKTTSGGVPRPDVDTAASVEDLKVPPTSAFRVGPGFDPSRVPALTLNLSATVPAAMAGETVEYAYRVNGGFYHPFNDEPRITIQDPLFWLQGRHTVEVMARIKGRPETLDPSPARVSILIDTVPPEIELIRTADGKVRAETEDLVSPSKAVKLSWSINGGGYGSYGDTRAIHVPAGAQIRVKARDEAGNTAELGASSEELADLPDEHGAQGGCALGGPAPLGSGLLLLMATLALLVLRRRE